jgi:hypothetical protein
VDREKLGLLARKVAIAAGIGFALVLVARGGTIADAVEAGDWDLVGELGYALLLAGAAGALRAIVALTTAFVPTDALNGANLLGKWKDAPVVTSSTPPTRIDVEP